MLLWHHLMMQDPESLLWNGPAFNLHFKFHPLWNSLTFGILIAAISDDPSRDHSNVFCHLKVANRQNVQKKEEFGDMPRLSYPVWASLSLQPVFPYPQPCAPGLVPVTTAQALTAKSVWLMSWVLTKQFGSWALGCAVSVSVPTLSGCNQRPNAWFGCLALALSKAGGDPRFQGYSYWH